MLYLARAFRPDLRHAARDELTPPSPDSRSSPFERSKYFSILPLSERFLAILTSEGRSGLCVRYPGRSYRGCPAYLVYYLIAARFFEIELDQATGLKEEVDHDPQGQSERPASLRRGPFWALLLAYRRSR